MASLLVWGESGRCSSNKRPTATARSEAPSMILTLLSVWSLLSCGGNETASDSAGAHYSYSSLLAAAAPSSTKIRSSTRLSSGVYSAYRRPHLTQDDSAIS